MNRIVFLYILSMLFSACVKEPDSPPVETLYPLPYLPDYPGSWWKYLNADGDTILHTTASEYIEHYYMSEKLNGCYTDPVRVPYWNGDPVYGYSTPAITHPQHPGEEGLSQVGYLSENTDDHFLVFSYKGVQFREVGITDTSIIINGNNYTNVIRVNEYSESSFYNHPLTLDYITYYAKDIGLIRKDNLKDSTIELQLVDYRINR